jgi:prolyl oligopeptidase
MNQALMAYDGEPIIDLIHGVAVPDPFRWLEDQNSTRTRAWLNMQAEQYRQYLDRNKDRDHLRSRVRDLLDIETLDFFLLCGSQCVFRKRTAGQEQSAICLRTDIGGPDEVLLHPKQLQPSDYTATIPLCLSPDCRLLLYQIKVGGERTGIYRIMDVPHRCTLPDMLPRGYLRSFAFARDSKGFFYCHESAGRSRHRDVYYHAIGSSTEQDRRIFRTEGTNTYIQIAIAYEEIYLIVSRHSSPPHTDVYVCTGRDELATRCLVRDLPYRLAVLFLPGARLLALTDKDSCNFGIVEIRKDAGQFVLADVVRPCEFSIQNWVATSQHLFVLYAHGRSASIVGFDLYGRRREQIIAKDGEMVRLLAGSTDCSELLYETESFVSPPEVWRYSPDGIIRPFARHSAPAAPELIASRETTFRSFDGTRIPMLLAGKPQVLAAGARPIAMTSYGGFGVPVTPRFSAFATYLMEKGCVLALPGIRGGGDFGAEWHHAGVRRNRKVSIRDFVRAAEWLVESANADYRRIAIFGGSNSGLLVAAAMAWRPELFCAVLCIAPMADMIRYHLFDDASRWKEEYGTAEDPGDFAALIEYSPYHHIRDNTSYPATLVVSGDRDQNCNPLHSRKLTARLQQANNSQRPVLLDYSHLRGHSPVLPFSVRVESLTNRLAFMCEQLKLDVRERR